MDGRRAAAMDPDGGVNVHARTGPDRAESPVRALATTEIRVILRRNSWGILATAHNDGRPYAVPSAYAWDGQHFYFVSKDGRKRRNLEANPTACLTVVEIEGNGRWRSIVATGTIEWVDAPHEWAGALQAIRAQWIQAAPPPSLEAARLEGARIFRLVPDELTGRAGGRREG